MNKEHLRKNLENFEDEKDGAMKEMLRIIIRAQVDRGERLLVRSAPGTPSVPSTDEGGSVCSDRKDGYYIPSGVVERASEDEKYEYWWSDGMAVDMLDWTAVPYRAVYQMNGILLRWHSGEYDEVMKAHFRREVVQRRWQEKWIMKVGHPLTEVRRQYGDPWRRERRRILEGRNPSNNSAFFIYL